MRPLGTVERRKRRTFKTERDEQCSVASLRLDD